ncbi:hypothetical protein ANN_06858 [Periplaneta americana]|uniref:Endonuclease-reverse transcriptase n=1 Tax=Periplaneta americana TaxID=6978 RepID=A0ABQ8TET7_PERAM|nr:hypothetical protein ANN_06858 [Periplaneta americana]
MWIWRRMERVKWTERIRNEDVLERVGEERMMLKLIRKKKRWEDYLRFALELRKTSVNPNEVTSPNWNETLTQAALGLESNTLLPEAKYLTSERLIKKIRREGVCAGDEKLESPGKNRPREPLILVDDMDRCTLRRKIQEFYTMQKEVPTLEKLLKAAREAINFQGGRETLRKEHRLRVFENKVLRKIFGAKRDEVTGEWRKLHNTELHALYSSPDIIRNIKSRRLRWAGHVARMGESRNAYTVLVGLPEGKRPLERPRRRWEDNIKMDLREVGYDGRDWINLAQDRDQWRAYVRAAMYLRLR